MLYGIILRLLVCCFCSLCAGYMAQKGHAGPLTCEPIDGSDDLKEDQAIKAMTEKVCMNLWQHIAVRVIDHSHTFFHSFQFWMLLAKDTRVWITRQQYIDLEKRICAVLFSSDKCKTHLLCEVSGCNMM